ncbi:MAG TPA: SDR family NAD(P)-dependent oxidoreductase, partial [Isoptericola sp.]|nr:SDR family NAD(P)-dependent oxidoreductase [Isoptericola sp.]
MTTTLITGATRGLGEETARRLAAVGHEVWIGARDVDRGRAVAARIGAHVVPLDVLDDDSVAAAADLVGEAGGLDVLVNNAGIEPRRAGNAIPTPADETAADVLRTFATNVLGVVRVTHAFWPLLHRSAAPVIVNVSSGLASLTGLSDPDGPTHFYPGLGYPASKAAVNALTVQYAKAFPAARVNAVEPGFTATALNGFAGTQTVAEGAE